MVWHNLSSPPDLGSREREEQRHTKEMKATRQWRRLCLEREAPTAKSASDPLDLEPSLPPFWLVEEDPKMRTRSSAFAAAGAPPRSPKQGAPRFQSLACYLGRDPPYGALPVVSIRCRKPQSASIAHGGSSSGWRRGAKPLPRGTARWFLGGAGRSE